MIAVYLRFANGGFFLFLTCLIRYVFSHSYSLEDIKLSQL